MDFENLETLSDWGKWKNTLSGAVGLGEKVGLSEKTIDGIAYRVGNILSASVDPENREERLLHELWSVGNKDERKALANMIVKMVKPNLH